MMQRIVMYFVIFAFGVAVPYAYRGYHLEKTHTSNKELLCKHQDNNTIHYNVSYIQDTN